VHQHDDPEHPNEAFNKRMTATGNVCDARCLGETMNAAYICKNALSKRAAVEKVALDSDGAWQFICGGSEHGDPHNIAYIHMIHVMDEFPHLAPVVHELMKRGLGWCAERSDEEIWHYYLMNEEKT
jgi:hypothetical protein